MIASAADVDRLRCVNSYGLQQQVVSLSEALGLALENYLVLDDGPRLGGVLGYR